LGFCFRCRFIVTSEQLQESGLFASPADCPELLGGTYADTGEEFSDWMQKKLARRAQVRKRSVFFAPFCAYKKPNICQDRLGTNIGQALTKGSCCLTGDRRGEPLEYTFGGI
jgi:hypothetical protein